MEKLEAFLTGKRDQYENELCDWLKMASVSTDSAFEKDVRSAADWLKNRMDSIGIKTEIIETCGHPIVYGETPKIEGAPTVLVLSLIHI